MDPLASSYPAYSPYNYVLNNPINAVDPDGRWVLRVLKTAYKVSRNAYKTYKKTGKFNAKSIGKALKKEGLDIIDNVSTLVDGNLDFNDAVAVVDLATGFGDELKAAKKAVGSYTITFKNGKKYHGKGPKSRARQSGKKRATDNETEVDDIDWKESSNDREAFKDEAKRMRKDGGVDNPNNYNKNNSPGEKYLEEDGVQN